MTKENKRSIEEEIDILKRAVFGDEDLGEQGMKDKVDEIHHILIQVKGLRGFLYILIAIGGAVTVIKGFIYK